MFDVVGEQHVHLADLRGHEGPVWQVAWAHPKFGQLLASCSFDHRVIVWKEQQDNQWQQVGAALLAWACAGRFHRTVYDFMLGEEDLPSKAKVNHSKISNICTGVYYTCIVAYGLY